MFESWRLNVFLDFMTVCCYHVMVLSAFRLIHQLASYGALRKTGHEAAPSAVNAVAFQLFRLLHFSHFT